MITLVVTREELCDLIIGLDLLGGVLAGISESVSDERAFELRVLERKLVCAAGDPVREARLTRRIVETLLGEE